MFIVSATFVDRDHNGDVSDSTAKDKYEVVETYAEALQKYQQWWELDEMYVVAISVPVKALVPWYLDTSGEIVEIDNGLFDVDLYNYIEYRGE